MTIGYRRMSSEDRGFSYFADCLFKRQPLGHLFACPLQGHKGGMAFIGMPDDWIDAQSPQYSNPSYAQNDLLLDTHFRFSDIQSGRELTIIGSITLNISVQKVNIDTAHSHQPNRDRHRPACKCNLSQCAPPILSQYLIY